jgi:hypothetical protein
MIAETQPEQPSALKVTSTTKEFTNEELLSSNWLIGTRFDKMGRCLNFLSSGSYEFLDNTGKSAGYGGTFEILPNTYTGGAHAANPTILKLSQFNLCFWLTGRSGKVVSGGF